MKRSKFLCKASHAHTCARPWGWRDRGDPEPGELRVGAPGRGSGAGERFLGRDKSGSRDSQLAGRGEGARADAHIPRPRPTPRTKWALSASPVPWPAGAEPTEGERRAGREDRRRPGAPRPRRSPAGRVSAGGRRAPGAARRQPSHRGARFPRQGPGLRGTRSGGAQGPVWGHRAAGSGRGVAAPDRLQHGRWRGRGWRRMLRGGLLGLPLPGKGMEEGPRGGEGKPAGSRSHGRRM